MTDYRTLNMEDGCVGGEGREGEDTSKGLLPAFHHTDCHKRRQSDTNRRSVKILGAAQLLDTDHQCHGCVLVVLTFKITMEDSLGGVRLTQWAPTVRAVTTVTPDPRHSVLGGEEAVELSEQVRAEVGWQAAHVRTVPDSGSVQTWV